jgi:hypothetical protein
MGNGAVGGFASLRRSSPETILANNYPLESIFPFVEAFGFEGRLGGSDTFVSGGGVSFVRVCETGRVCYNEPTFWRRQ